MAFFIARRVVPSNVPSCDDQTVYLVINNFGNLGAAFSETDADKADLETVIGDLMSGQHGDPVCDSRADPSQSHAGDPDNAGGLRRVDARAMG